MQLVWRIAMIPMKEIRRRAAGLGIRDVDKMDRTQRIRAIQVREGHTPCYNTPWCKPEWKEHCAWKDECGAEDYFPD